MRILVTFLCLTVLLFFSPFANAQHWDKNLINVYIPSKNSKSTDMQNAFLQWQNKLNDRIRFNFVEKGPADIDVIFADKVSGTDGNIGDCKLTSSGDKITKAEIFISKSSYKKYSNDLIYVVMLHEVGHALGLPDTNMPSSKGIMHNPINEGQRIKASNIRKLHGLYRDTKFLKTK